MAPDDRTLLRKTHAGHEASARELWQRHAGWMLAYARSLLGNRAGADDAVQATFCRILTLDRRTVRRVREVRPWLAALLRRQALNDLRASRRAGARERREPTRPPASPAPGGPELADAMARLPRRLREVVHLRHVAGLTTDQAALALDIPRGTVASRHHTAIAALRTMLKTELSPASVVRGGPVHANAI